MGLILASGVGSGVFVAFLSTQKIQRIPNRYQMLGDEGEKFFIELAMSEESGIHFFQ